LLGTDCVLLLVQHILPPKTYGAAKALALSAGVALMGIVLVLLVGYVMASPTFGWTGAVFTLKHLSLECLLSLLISSLFRQAGKQHLIAKTHASNALDNESTSV